MTKNIKNIAIITARKNSRRIKNKSTKIFHGKPIIYYTIKALKKSKIFDKIFLSTNCLKTIKTSKKYGIKDIIFRKEHYNKNNIGTISVINSCIRQLKKKNIYPKFICCNYPASPLTNYRDLRIALNTLKKKKINFIFPVIKINNPDNEKNKIIKIDQIKKKKGIVNKQFLDAGQFWYAKTKTWINSKTVYDKNSFFLKTEFPFSDINTLRDWSNVKKIFLKYRKNN